MTEPDAVDRWPIWVCPECLSEGDAYMPCAGRFGEPHPAKKRERTVVVRESNYNDAITALQREVEARRREASRV